MPIYRDRPIKQAQRLENVISRYRKESRECT